MQVFLRQAAAAALCLATLASGLPAGEVLFDFNAKNPLYSFKNNESQVSAALADDSVFPNSKSLKVDYSFSGKIAYVGLGVGFSYLSAKSSQWDRFGADGGLTFVAKSSEPSGFTVVVSTAEGSFSAAVATSAEWTRFYIPFATLKDKNGNAFDALKQKPQKLELRPRSKPAAASFYLDEIGFAEKVAEARQEPAAAKP